MHMPRRPAGRCLQQPQVLSGSPVQHRPSAVPRPARRAAAAVAAMQRLKPQPGKGTQRLGRPKESGKTGTQRSGGGTTPVEKQAKKVSVGACKAFGRNGDMGGCTGYTAFRPPPCASHARVLPEQWLSRGVSAHIGGADSSPEQPEQRLSSGVPAHIGGAGSRPEQPVRTDSTCFYRG